MLENHCDCQPQDAKLVAAVKKTLPPLGLVGQLGDFFKIMGDGTRLRLLLALQRNELCVSDLANVLDMTRSAVSHQLKVLRLSKLIKQRKVGRTVYYSLDDEHVNDVLLKSFEHIQEK